MKLTENMKLWLTKLYDNEIEEARCAAANENLWALGSDTQESAIQHSINSEEQRAYIEVLKELKELIK